jgi:hypothetical protein
MHNRSVHRIPRDGKQVDRVHVLVRTEQQRRVNGIFNSLQATDQAQLYFGFTHYYGACQNNL